MQALQVNFSASAVIIPKAGCGVQFADAINIKYIKGYDLRRFYKRRKSSAH